MEKNLARLSGVPGVKHTKGTPVDHCCHGTAGYKKMEETLEEGVPARMKRVI